jgi:FOG: Glucan-binding domain (YG repeat)
MKKKYISLLLGITLSLSTVVIAKADSISPGWKNDNGTWYFLNRNGSYATGWFRDGANWYYLQYNGAMKIGWLQDGGNWYYLNSNGAMAHDTTVDGYYLAHTGEWTTNIPASANSGSWTCPQIQSTAPSDVSAGFKILHDELGFGYTSGWAGYSNYVDNPTEATPTALDVTKLVTKKYNAEIMIQINAWDSSQYVKNSDRIKPIGQQLFKFYFGDSYMTLYNIVEGGDKNNLNTPITIGNREVLLAQPSSSLMIWISAPGEHITK